MSVPYDTCDLSLRNCRPPSPLVGRGFGPTSLPSRHSPPRTTVEPTTDAPSRYLHTPRCPSDTGPSPSRGPSRNDLRFLLSPSTLSSSRPIFCPSGGPSDHREVRRSLPVLTFPFSIPSAKVLPPGLETAVRPTSSHSQVTIPETPPRTVLTPNSFLSLPVDLLTSR